MAADLIIVVVLIVTLLLIVGALWRVSAGKQLTEAAAASGARAASLATTPAQASADAQAMAADTLSQGGVACRDVRVQVDLAQFSPGGQVSVSVTCTADLSSLVMKGLPRTKVLTATAISPLETYRQVTGSQR